MNRIDERDIMFSRMSYEKGSEQYRDYYTRNPEKQSKDDELRKGLNLFGPTTKYYDMLDSNLCEATFQFLADIKKYAEGLNPRKKVTVETGKVTEKLREIARYYGAVNVGIVRMTQEMYYSHRGRMPEVYGQPVDNIHPYGIVFAVEMEKEKIDQAPAIQESIAVTKGYVTAAIIGMVISYFIRGLGYAARNHMDGNYLVMATRVAAAGGLGKIGRSGLLITDKYGPRVRLGVVTTDLEMIYEAPQKEYCLDFCRTCGRCSHNCPAGAIPGHNQGEWKVEPEKCFETWKRYGTDCGMCIKVCPFNK